MGYEISYFFHPRKAEGGYETATTEEKSVKVGKPFDDTPLEKCAAAIMAQLARRDIWVVDVKVFELVKNEISFKECTDGRGILLKNKKYALGSTEEALAEDLVEIVEQTPPVYIAPPQLPPGVQPHQVAAHPLQPHEMIRNSTPTDLSNLYDGKAAVPIQRKPRPPIDQNKIMYSVFYEPYMYQAEANMLKLKFTENKKYPVHAVIPAASGRLDAQQIAVTDDSGKVMILDEKFFTSTGRGLLGDDELGFSGSVRRENRPRLMHDEELTLGTHPAERTGAPYKQIRKNNQRDIPAGIPIDDGGIPADMLAVPDLRPGRKP